MPVYPVCADAACPANVTERRISRGVMLRETDDWSEHTKGVRLTGSPGDSSTKASRAGIRHRGLGQALFSTAAKIARGLYTPSGGMSVWARSFGLFEADSWCLPIAAAFLSALGGKSFKTQSARRDRAEYTKNVRNQDRTARFLAGLGSNSC